MSATESVVNLLITVGGGGVGLAVINQIFARRRTNAEAESIEIDTSAKVLKTVGGELERLHARFEALEERFDASERQRALAERRAVESEWRESMLQEQVDKLTASYNATRSRVDQLTALLVASGVDVPPWTPPSGIR